MILRDMHVHGTYAAITVNQRDSTPYGHQECFLACRVPLLLTRFYAGLPYALDELGYQYELEESFETTVPDRGGHPTTQECSWRESR